MKAVDKFEALMNKLILKSLELSKKLMIKMTPQKVKDKARLSQIYIEGRKEKGRQKYGLIKEKVSSRAQGYIDQVSDFDYKQKIEFVKSKTDEIKTSVTGIDYKNSHKVAFSSFVSLMLSMKTWVLALSPIKLAGILLVSASISVTGVHFVVQTNNQASMIPTSKVLQRKPASIKPTKEVYETSRAPYYKRTSKQIQIQQIRFPVYITGPNSMRFLLIDFTVEANNRYTAKCISKNEFLVRDHLISTIQPILPQFPLKEEGKVILKSKLENEINEFLKNQKVRGKVKKIYIDHLVSG